MSRTYKDKPYRLGGKRTKYWISPKSHAKFTRDCRQRARARAKRELKNTGDCQPGYPVEREYFD